MTTTSLHPTAVAYVKRLRHASRGLPRDAREDLVSDIEAHLHEAIGVDTPDAEVLMILDRLGSPDDIISAQLNDTASPLVSSGGIREWATVILLLLGGFVFGVGWLVGLVLLWSSRAWTTVDKLIGTLLLPGGLAGTLIIALLTASKRLCTAGAGLPTRCTGGPSAAHQILAIVLLAMGVVVPIATAIHLARRARRPT